MSSSYYLLIDSYLDVIYAMEEEQDLDFKNFEFSEVALWIAKNKDDNDSMASRFIADFDAKDRKISLGLKPHHGFSTYFRQAYMILYRLRMHGPTDLRPVHILRRLCPSGKDCTSLPARMLTIGFLLGKTFEPNRGSKGPERPFGYSTPTGFEKTMFMAMLYKAYTVTKLGGSADRKTRKRAKTTQLPALTGDRTSSMKLASIVQSIIRAWDTYAYSVGFKNCEEMVLPYITFGADNIFRALPSRSAGYSPVYQETALEERGKLKPTHTASLITPAALSLPDNVDSALRELSGIFLEDLDRLVLDNDLYEYEEHSTAPWAEVVLFHRKDGEALPKRFDDIDMNLTTVIREEHSRGPVPLSGPPGNAQEEDDIFLISDDEGPNLALDNSVELVEVVSQDIHAELDKPSESVGGQSSAGPSRKCPPTCTCPDAISAEDEILKEMSHSFRAHCCRFDGFNEAEDFCAGGVPVGGRVQLVLTDPPFNYRRERREDDSWYDSISADEMEEVGVLMSELLRPGGHALIYTSPLQFSEWHRILAKTQFEEEDGGSGTAFHVDAEPLIIVRQPGHYKTNPTVKSTALAGVCDYLVHLTRVGETLEVSHGMVDYRPQGYVASRHTGWTNVIDNLERLPPNEKVMKPNGNPLRKEQKSRASLMELISRFSKPGDIVVDLFSGTFSTAAACIDLPGPRSFVGCEMDEEACELGKRISVIPALTRRILDGTIKSSATVKTRAAFLLEHRGDVSPHELRDIAWRPPSGLPGFQTLPPHILRFLSITSGYKKIATEAEKVPVSSWTPGALAHLLSTDPTVLLAAECVQVGLTVQASAIKHPAAGRGVFACKPIFQGQMITYYYGAMVYDNLLPRPQSSKLYGLTGMLGVDVKTFRHKAVSLKGPKSDMGGDKWPAKYYVVAAPFCVAGYINDAAYMDGDAELDKKVSGSPRRTVNVKLKMRQTSHTVGAISGHTVCYVVATRDIKVGEELYMDYKRS